MCGIAGLAVGCSVAPVCPKSLFKARRDGTAAAPDASGRSPLRTWNERASVRTRPHPSTTDRDALLFPEAFVPIARHPLVAARDPAVSVAIRARHLHRYLDFTAKLEHLVVNRTVLALAHEATGFRLPEWMRLDAYKIYVDEGYHAFIAADLSAQVVHRYGLETCWEDQPYFLTRLQELLSAADADLRPLIEILFVVVSETLISGSLSEASELEDLGAPVRQALGDHAHDERRHHAYFAHFLKALWPQLDPSVQERAAPHVPDLIDAFLRPDLANGYAELIRLGFPAADARMVLFESYPKETVEADRRNIARHAVRYFEQVGALSSAVGRAAFESAGLLEGSQV